MNSAESVDVLLYLPGSGPVRISVDGSRPIAEILKQAGVDEDLFIVAPDVDAGADDGDADVDASLVTRDRPICELSMGRAIALHCHTCRQVQVSVNYQKETIRRRFPPSTRARRVVRWAKRKLALNDADADNLALFLCKSGEQVRETAHLGELAAHGHCELCFDLAKDRNIEGASDVGHRIGPR